MSAAGRMSPNANRLRRLTVIMAASPIGAFANSIGSSPTRFTAFADGGAMRYRPLYGRSRARVNTCPIVPRR
jgi:hypothetical protein